MVPEGYLTKEQAIDLIREKGSFIIEEQAHGGGTWSVLKVGAEEDVFKFAVIMHRTPKGSIVNESILRVTLENFPSLEQKQNW